MALNKEKKSDHYVRSTRLCSPKLWSWTSIPDCRGTEVGKGRPLQNSSAQKSSRSGLHDGGRAHGKCRTRREIAVGP